MASPGQMNRFVSLMRPPVKTADSFGEPVSNASPIEYKVWSSWKEQGGGETVTEQQEIGVTTITADIWWHSNIEDINTQWWLVGEDGLEYDLVAAEELGGRRWMIRLKLVKRV